MLIWDLSEHTFADSWGAAALQDGHLLQNPESPSFCCKLVQLAATPSVLTLRMHNRRERACFPLPWSKLVDFACPESHCVVVSLSGIQVVLLLPRKETAVYLEAQAASLDSILRQQTSKIGLSRGKQGYSARPPLYKKQNNFQNYNR